MIVSNYFPLYFILLAVDPGLTKSRIRNFPDGFEFGASSSAYQVEGAWNEDGKGPSIWDDAVHAENSPIKDRSTGNIASDSYHNIERDVEIMKDLGLDFYRFSISWPRILPNGFTNQINPKGVDYYNKLINTMLKHNIKPFVTIYHWDLPSSLQKLGGWTNNAIIVWFHDYAKVLFDKFGDRVQRWVTFNEPKQICFEGYGSDSKAPFLNFSGIADYICVKNVLMAHANVFHVYDAEYRRLQNGSVGISIGHDWFEPASEVLDDYQAAVDARQFYWGIFDHAIFSKAGDYPPEVKQNVAAKSAEQGYPRSRLPELSAREVAYIRGSADFLGINAYTTKLTYRDASLEGMYATPSFKDDVGAVVGQDPTWPRATSPWLHEVPWGFHKALLEVKRLYDNPPVYITENGWSTKHGLLDDERIRYLRNYLNVMLDAIYDGCNVKGYSVWSMIDNFEWVAAYNERFGLYEVDFSSRDKARTPRKSAFVYKEITRSKTLDLDFEPESFIINVEVRDSQENVTDIIY